MATTIPKGLLAVRYEAAAQEYLRNLPLAHFMEPVPQATQRKITLESLDLVSARRHDVHAFNERLVQYPVKGQKRLRQVVPDNMVVLSEEPIEGETSYNVPLEPARPFWMDGCGSGTRANCSLCRRSFNRSWMKPSGS